MPGRTATTWGKTWKTGQTRVIRVPAGLADELLKLAHAMEDGAQIKVILQPGLFDAPKKRKQPVTGGVPRGTVAKKSKPVTRRSSPHESTPKKG